METANLLLSILTAVATTAIAIVVYHASMRVNRAQIRLGLLTAVNDFNALCLMDDNCLRAATEVLTGEQVRDIDEARRTWAVYSLLNNRQLHYFSGTTEHTSRKYLASDADVLKTLMRYPGARTVLLQGGYDPEFVDYCLEHAPDETPSETD